MDYQPIDIDGKFALFSDQWSPKVIGKVNNYLVKLARLQGDFIWHAHAETDELFLVHRGTLRIDLRGGQVTLHAGQIFIVPRGVEHRPHADEECEVILLEPETTLNTGDVRDERTIEHPEWI